jgi:hypothetical protein
MKLVVCNGAKNPLEHDLGSLHGQPLRIGDCSFNSGGCIFKNLQKYMKTQQISAIKFIMKIKTLKERRQRLRGM